jgi:hypothetical protein
VHKLKGSVGVLKYVIRARQKLETLLEVVRDVAEELYTGTHTTRQAVRASRHAVLSRHHRGKEHTNRRKPTSILQALEDLIDDVSELTIGLDAFSEFAPEVASIYTHDLQSEIQVGFPSV